MAISYGSDADGKQIAKSYEWLAVQDTTGDVADNILKYTRLETTTETVESTFGCPTLDGDEVINATITWSVDEALVEASGSGTAPQAVRLYNVKCECSVTYLGSANMDSTFSFDSVEFETVSSEVSETLGDVKKVTVRGVSYGSNNSLTLGNGVGGGTIRKEKRFSNTDFVRSSVTTVAFNGS